MEQHPVPQNVTTFQFRLIGDMTIKQFGYLCAGAILAFVFFNLPAPILITWPLSGAFLFLGIGFAFIPIEERPMDVWVFSFFKSIYSPTQYIWQQQPSPVAPPPAAPSVSNPVIQNNTITQPPINPAPPTHTPTLIPTSPEPPIVHKPQTPPTPTQPIQPTQQDVKNKEKMAQMEQMLQSLQAQLSTHALTQERVVELQKQLTEVISQKSILENEVVTLRRQIAPANTAPQAPTTAAPTHQPTVKIISSADALKIGLPKLTNLPNVITGIIKDDTNNFLPGILVTVINNQKVPMRAFKTNKLGQFGATTPLPNGVYLIEIEDPRKRFIFDRAQLTLTGIVVPAIEIIAKGEKQVVREKLTQEIFGSQNM